MRFFRNENKDSFFCHVNHCRCGKNFRRMRRGVPRRGSHEAWGTMPTQRDSGKNRLKGRNRREIQYQRGQTLLQIMFAATCFCVVKSRCFLRGPSRKSVVIDSTLDAKQKDSHIDKRILTLTEGFSESESHEINLSPKKLMNSEIKTKNIIYLVLLCTPAFGFGSKLNLRRARNSSSENRKNYRGNFSRRSLSTNDSACVIGKPVTLAEIIRLHPIDFRPLRILILPIETASLFRLNLHAEFTLCHYFPSLSLSSSLFRAEIFPQMRSQSYSLACWPARSVGRSFVRSLARWSVGPFGHTHTIY